jgi:hypothetical protein
MSTTISVKPAGPTYAISVANSQSTAIGVAPVQGDAIRFAEFYNSGATQVCVVTAPYASTAATPTLVFPAAGTPTVPNSFMLPANMTQPRVVAVPANGFSVSAIGSAAGPSIIYITPLSQL